MQCLNMEWLEDGSRGEGEGRGRGVEEELTHRFGIEMVTFAQLT